LRSSWLGASSRAHVEVRALARDAARPHVIDQDAIPVAVLGRFVGALGTHIERHRRSRVRVGDARPERLLVPQILLLVG
jgi:hypothetical protein